MVAPQIPKCSMGHEVTVSTIYPGLLGTKVIPAATLCATHLQQFRPARLVRGLFRPSLLAVVFNRILPSRRVRMVSFILVKQFRGSH